MKENKTKFYKVFGHLFMRALKQSTRPLAAILPSFFMPFFFFIVNSAGFQRIVDLPGFDSSSYLSFYAPVALLMAVFFTSGDAGFELMLDITSGYFEKLLLTPTNRLAILLPRIVAMGLRAMAQAAIMLILLLLFGASFKGGAIGIVLVFLLVMLFGMGWSGIGLTMAALTKNPRVLQSSFILVFPLTFMTTAQLPLNLLSGWYKVAVQINPITQILEGVRAIMTDGAVYSHQVLNAFIVVIALIVITATSAIISFRRMAN